MSELKSYVNGLFAKYKNSQTDELKAEILSNLEAKKADLIESGLDEETAIQKAKNSITSVAHLIDGNREVFINQYRLDCLQQALIYLAVAWIVTIPFMVVGSFVNLYLLCAVIVVGIVYLCKRADKREKRGYLNVRYYNKIKQIVWLFWAIFFIISILALTGMYFGSNLWFSRPIKIDGPYNFALMLARYFTPLVTIVLPLSINSLPKYIIKNEVNSDAEQEK